MNGLLQAAIVEGLRRHPRVEQQEFAAERAVREQICAAIPRIRPFAERLPAQIVAVLDWDHRLPSKALVLRLHLFRNGSAVREFEAAWTERRALIARRDLYPEFDVPDLAEFPADEAYELELGPELKVDGIRLVSPWRREVERGLSERSITAVRKSDAWKKLKGSGRRPPFLGDLQAVGWMPPCESGLDVWTIDVWWLTSFDGRIGKGTSFLVDDDGEICAQREFQVRAG